jgi:hypothetical protein
LLLFKVIELDIVQVFFFIFKESFVSMQSFNAALFCYYRIDNTLPSLDVVEAWLKLSQTLTDGIAKTDIVRNLCRIIASRLFLLAA